jgi:hypothetical protein
MNTSNNPPHDNEVYKLRAENEHLRRTNMGMVSRVIHEAALAEIQKVIDSLAADAARYRWLKAQPDLHLALETDGSFWPSLDETPYAVSYSLSAGGTAFNGAKTLDEAIDAFILKDQLNKE